MSLFLAILSALALLSLLFAGAIALEARRVERMRRDFLRSIKAPQSLRLRDGILRIVYLAGALGLVLALVALPHLLDLLPADNG